MRLWVLGQGGGGGGSLPILNNNQFLQAKTTTAVVKDILGITLTDRLQLGDATGTVGVVMPGGLLQIGVLETPLISAINRVLVTANASVGFVLGSAVAAAGSSPQFNGVRSRGTWAAPTAVLNGDRLFIFNAQGYDGASYLARAAIEFLAAENWAAGANGTAISFQVTPNTTAARVAALILNQNSVAIFGTNTATSPGLKEFVAGRLCARLGDDSAYAPFDALSYFVGGTAGVDGSFISADAKTVTVSKGIVTGIV